MEEVHTRRDGVVRLDEVAGIKAVLAAAEVRKLRQRFNDTLQDRADEGRPAGGRSYGYRHETLRAARLWRSCPRRPRPPAGWPTPC